MLTFLFALAAIWTLFWFVMLMLDWGDRTPLIDSKVTDNKALCSTCANSIEPGSVPIKPTTSESESESESETIVNDGNASAKSKINDLATTPVNANNVTPITAARAASDNIVKKPVADQHDQANVTPLFEKPDHVDDLKTIKGIGVVMERTLNDLGITTFKQLADFQQAEVTMVSNVLTESNAGFGDRIERDEWVDQAKSLVKKAS